MEWNTKPVPTSNAEEILSEYKIEDYAELCLVNLDRYRAALELADGNQIAAMAISHHWANSYQLEKLIRGLKNDPRAIRKIATKFDVAMLYWSMANSMMIDAKDRINAAKEFASITGLFDSKIGSGGGTNINVGSAVMLVKDFGTQEDWEKSAAIQQSNLVNQRNEQRESRT